MVYGAKTWGMKMNERHQLDVMKINRLSSMCGVISMDRWWNEEVKRRFYVREAMDVWGV